MRFVRRINLFPSVVVVVVVIFVVADDICRMLFLFLITKEHILVVALILPIRSVVAIKNLPPTDDNEDRSIAAAIVIGNGAGTCYL
jgi:hypothetical protein